MHLYVSPTCCMERYPYLYLWKWLDQGKDLLTYLAAKKFYILYGEVSIFLMYLLLDYHSNWSS